MYNIHAFMYMYMQVTTMLTFSFVFISLLHFGLAQPPRGKTCIQDRKTQCSTSPPYKMPTIHTDEKFRYITTIQCPPYENPGWTNPAQACQFPNTYEIPLKPVVANTPIPVGEVLAFYENITYLKVTIIEKGDFV